MQERDEHLPEVFQVIDKHDVAQLLFLLHVTATLRQVVVLVALNARFRPILSATECLSQHFIKGLEVVLDPFILLGCVVLRKFIQVCLLEELG